MLAVPFFKDVLLAARLVGFLLFAILVMVGASNAVNLTDGLDGLAIVPVIIAAGVFALIAYWSATPSSPTTCSSTTSRASGELAVLLRRAGRRRPGLPVVQRAARHGVHGRHRLARRSAARWARSPSSPSTRSCWPSSAACSCSRPCR